MATHGAGNMCGGILDFLSSARLPSQSQSPLKRAQLFIPAHSVLLPWRTITHASIQFIICLCLTPLVASISSCVEQMIANMLPNFLAQLGEQRRRTSILDLFNGWVLLRTRRTN